MSKTSFLISSGTRNCFSKRPHPVAWENFVLATKPNLLNNDIVIAIVIFETKNIVERKSDAPCGKQFERLSFSKNEK